MTATQLTDREQQIRTLVADGLTNDDIAARLKISSRTVESHLRMLFRKLGVTRRDQVTFTDLESGPTTPVENLEEQLRSYETAIMQITDRQTPLFTERVEITVSIGETAAEDAIVERRWTRPKPYLVYRVARPILPTDQEPPLTADDLAVSCEVVDRDVGVAVKTILDRKRRHQLLVTFQPGLEHETEWVLRYRTPGLWNPLRTTGADMMFWLPGVMEKARTATSITKLDVRFLPPSGLITMDVTERRGLGVTEREHLADGRPVLLWRDLQPSGGRYEWELKMRREASAR